MSNLSDINQIFERCIKGVATPEERHLFWKWVDTPENEGEARKLIENAFPSPEHPVAIDSDSMESIIQAIFNAENRNVPVVHFLKTAWFRYAAVLLLIAGTATFLYLNNQPQKQQIVRTQQPAKKTDILPGGNKAILTLADGSTIVLDSAGNGSLAEQGGTKIIKLQAGALAYNAGNTGSEILYNTISTPKGGQYQITLPDGTKVWLNAVSSIRFPTTFVKERKVTVTGEVYLEVSKNKAKPFSVQTGTIDVQVLGTSFNINAYPDETAVKATLVEGSIQLVRHSQAYSNPAAAMPKKAEQNETVILQPGQQAVVKDNIQVRNEVNTEQITAWKNGWFSFYKADLPTVMRQLARWYNFEVVYKDSIPSLLFTGKIDRELMLTQVMNNLAGSGVRYTIQDRKIIILP